MITSNLARVSAELPHERNLIADGGAQGFAQGPVQGPMSQQDAADCHGHDMHPQKFVRLVGCHESNSARDQAEYRLH
jgi:hypothetical protein